METWKKILIGSAAAIIVLVIIAIALGDKRGALYNQLLKQIGLSAVEAKKDGDAKIERVDMKIKQLTDDLDAGENAIDASAVRQTEIDDATIGEIDAISNFDEEALYLDIQKRLNGSAH